MNRAARRFELSFFATRERSRSRFARVGELTRRANALRIEADCDSVPIDMARLAKHLGVLSIAEVPLAMKGRLLSDGNSMTLEVNCDLPESESRFTIAHELSHIIVEGDELRNHPSRLTRSKAMAGHSNVVTERLCDAVAWELLLPYEWLKRRLDDGVPRLSSLIEVAKGSACSVEAVADRILDLGLWSCRLIWWTRRRGYFRATRSSPSMEEEFLCFVRPGNQRETLLRQALKSEGIVFGRDTVCFREEANEGQVQCLRLDDGRVLSLIDSRH